MEDAADAIIESWSIQLWPTVGLVLLAVIYFRGWLKLRRQVPHRFDGWRLTSFLGGVATVFLALDSPLDTFSNLLLQAHMVQHLLLMMIAPPLLLLGNPFLPLLTGLPRPFVREVIRPFLLWNVCKRFGRWLTNPKVTWILFVVLTLGWHAPPLYELTLRSPTWHIIEHACFLGSGTLFWWPVVQPWPSRPQWPEWAIIPYLLLADVQNTVLSAFLTFSDRVVYPTYGLVPQFPGMNPLSDQHAAGAIMWVPGSIFYLIPAGILAMRFLSPRRHAAARDELLLSRSRVLAKDTVPLVRLWFNPARSKKRSDERGIVPSGRVDLLALGWVGRVIRSLAFRRVVQGVLFGLAMLIVCDGLFGPQIGPMNLAGTLPWTHWRGLSVLALLVFGNFFCFACPFTFARDLGRRILPANRQWPRWLRTKWVSAGLLAIYLWSYEAFGLWNSPWLTAWVIIGYFVAAIVVDGFFRGASFCKYVCPIGQFNFVQSLVSPFEVKTRNLDVCHTCKSFDCIKGNQQQRGCELRLFQPKKESNLDCTFCLDCVRACPHDNIGIIAVPPGRTLARDHFRSSIGRFAERTDLTALVLVLVFGAFLNAASMTLPVENALSFSRLTLDLISRPVVLLVFFSLVLGLLPLIAIAGCALASRWLGSITGTVRPIACRFTMTLVPLGAAMWLAHFGFHLFTALLTPIPVIQRLFLDLHIAGTGTPWWSLHTPAIPQLLDFQCLALDLGLLVSLYFAWRVSVSLATKRKALAAFLPWGVLLSLLYVAGIWIVFQPMEMRGMLH
ncbi:MAG: cytochrome c oxidase assembly protein [Verrucomicrobia bacterium]|nr:cytochrome c oxidase assembly protein [Verrucomicrobiota bacterium]